MTTLALTSLAFAQSPPPSAPVALPQPTETGFIQVEDDVRLYYHCYGTGQPRIFISNRADLSTSFASLLANHNVVTWDTRGRALSDRPSDLSRYGLDVEISDAEAVRRHFGAERITYVGMSLYGSIAALYAARHPESVARVVAISPLPVAAELGGPPDNLVVHDLSALEAERDRMIAEGRHLTEPYQFCHLEKYILFADSYVSLDMMQTFVDANMCQYPNERHDLFLPVIFEGIFGDFGEWDWRDEVARITQPFLVIYGDHDSSPLSSLRLYAELAADGGFVEAPNAGHSVMIDRPDIVLPALDAFFRGEWPAGVNR